MHVYYALILSIISLSIANGSAAQESATDTATSSIIPDTIPLEDFFRNPERSSFKISPNGKYVSYRAPHEGVMNLFVQKVGDKQAVRVTNSTNRDIGGYFWKGDRIIYTVDLVGDENYVLVAVDPDGKNESRLSPTTNVRAGLLDDLKGVRGMARSIMVQMNERNPQVFDPYLVNIETGETKALYDNSSDNFEGWVTDHNGVIRFASRTDGVTTIWYYRVSDKEPFTEYMQVGFKDNWTPLFFTFDNARCYVSGNLNGRDKTAIVEWDIANKKEAKEIYANKDYDVDGLDYSRARQVLTVVTYTGEKWEKVFLDERTKKLHDGLQAQFPSHQIMVVSENEAEDKCIIWVGSDRLSGTYYCYDSATGKATLLADRKPWLKEEQLAEMKPISFSSRDGLTIHGYVTLPKGRKSNGLPLVVIVHGGPWARDEWTFNPEVQFLANRGYAVLQLNFRGSTGYGRVFWQASFKQWGRAMQNDITDGVHWIVQQQIADPDRVAIYGGSYGGYSTLAGLTYTPDLFACGIDYVGVNNLFTFMGTIPPYWQPFLEMLHEMVGDPVTDSLMLREVSPAFNLHRIKRPLLVAQGTHDPRVLKDETDSMVSALRAQGVEVDYLVKEGEGHGFHIEENRFEFYRRMEEFLAAHIGRDH